MEHGKLKARLHRRLIRNRRRRKKAKEQVFQIPIASFKNLLIIAGIMAYGIEKLKNSEPPKSEQNETGGKTL